MIDAHCHLDDPRFAEDLAAVLGRAEAAGVTEYVLAGVSPSGWSAQEALAAAYPQMSLTVGLHPWLCARASDDQAQELLAQLRARLADPARPRPVAVGEIGLHRAADTADDSLLAQERLFHAQLELAAAHDLPVVLHILRAHERALQVLRAHGPLRHGGLMHSYSGAPELVRPYAALGLSFSFTGPVTYPGARRPLEAVRAVPPDRLLLETDAPDQAPAHARAEAQRDGRAVGARNEPAFLQEIAAAVAAARGESLEEVQRSTAENTRRLFRLGGARAAFLAPDSRAR